MDKRVPDLLYRDPLREASDRTAPTERCWACGRGYPDRKPPFLVSAGELLKAPLCEKCSEDVEVNTIGGRQ